METRVSRRDLELDHYNDQVGCADPTFQRKVKGITHFAYKSEQDLLKRHKTAKISDGGTGLRELGQDLLRRNLSSIVGHMLFSHSHWDHIQGFPFFTPAYMPGNTFCVYGHEPGDRRMFDLLSGQMRSEYFPVNFADLGANIVAADVSLGGGGIEGIGVNFLKQAHPGGSYAFALEKDGGKIIYATDTEYDLLLLNREATLEDLQVPREMPPEYIEFARGADLLIVDSQFFDEEYPGKVGWGHPRALTAVDWGIQAGVKHLVLFHHDPMHADPDVERKVALCRARAEAQGSEMLISGAREGLEFKVNPEAGA